jgi:ABC-type transporter Mla MlaB component
MPFSAGVEQARVVKLSGELTASAVPTLIRLLSIDEHVLVDCSKVNSMDDAVLELLGDFHDERILSGRMFYMCGVHGGPLREAQVRGFSHFLCGAVAADRPLTQVPGEELSDSRNAHLLVVCSFCGVAENLDAGVRLISSPNVAICSSCVRLASGALAESAEGVVAIGGTSG